MNLSFLEPLQRFSFLRIPDFIALFKLSSMASFKKGEIIIKEGEYSKYAFFITKGVIRTYMILPNGEERTTTVAQDFRCQLRARAAVEHARKPE